MDLTREDLLPFIETSQYMDFAMGCDDARKYRVMMLCTGETGAGKSNAARRYANARKRMTGNGQSSTLYVQLATSDKTDRALNNTLIAAITREPREDRSAAVARAEVIRLIGKYGYDSLILDEGGYMLESGYEEARTLYDLMDRFPIIIIVMPKHRTRIERLVPAFYSRIAEHVDFDDLSIDQIRDNVLPNLSAQSHLKLPSDIQAKEAIVKELAALGKGNFRNVMDILVKTNDLIQKSIDIHNTWLAELPNEEPPPTKPFSVETIREAAKKSKRIAAAADKSLTKDNETPPDEKTGDQEASGAT